jgi:cation transport regulator ChaB
MNGEQSFINNMKTFSDSSMKPKSIRNSLNNNMVKIFKELLNSTQKAKEFRDFKYKMRKGEYKKISNLNKQWNSNKDNNIMRNKKTCLIIIKKRLTLSSKIVNK